MTGLCVTNCFHVKIGQVEDHTGSKKHRAPRDKNECNTKMFASNKKKLSGLNFLREVKETRNKRIIETLNPIST